MFSFHQLCNANLYFFQSQQISSSVKELFSRLPYLLLWFSTRSSVRRQLYLSNGLRRSYPRLLFYPRPEGHLNNRTSCEIFRVAIRKRKLIEVARESQREEKKFKNLFCEEKCFEVEKVFEGKLILALLLAFVRFGKGNSHSHIWTFSRKL